MEEQSTAATMQERTKPAQNLDFNESIANASNMNDDTGGACATVDSRSVRTWGTDQGSGERASVRCKVASIAAPHGDHWHRTSAQGIRDRQETAKLLASSTMIVEEMR